LLVFPEQRLVILATPKTGSTALAAALAPLAGLVARTPALKHTPVRRYRRFLAPFLAAATGGGDFTVVALMREPVDWLGSWWRYRMRPELAGSGRSTAGLSFDAFVRAWCSAPQPDYAAVGSQARFLAAGPGARGETAAGAAAGAPVAAGVDLLFRYEDMPAFLDFLALRLGRGIELPRRNVSPAAPLDLAPQTRRRLRRVAAADFALYAGIGRHAGV
jgi:hypothetical protein